MLPGMFQRRWGRVVAISVLDATSSHDSPAFAYFVGKAARTHAMLLTRDQAWKNEVTVNVMAPGPVSGIKDLEQAVEQCDHGPAWQKRTNTSPQDIAEGVAFLCSDAGRFVTGCEMPYSFH